MSLLGASPLLVLHASRFSLGTIALLLALACLACFLEFLRSGKRLWLAGWSASVLAGWESTGIGWVVGIQEIAMLLYWKRYRARQPIWWTIQILLSILFFWYCGSPPRLCIPFFSSYGAGLEAVADLMARTATGLSFSIGWTGSLFPVFPLLVGLWVCRDARRDPRHGLLVLALSFSGAAHLLDDRCTSCPLVFLVCWCTLVSIGLRHLPRWARQALWGAIGMVYLWSYWHLL